MKDIIANNEKSINILNKLIQNGYYLGSIGQDRIELNRKKGFLTTESYNKIVGILNPENKFVLDYEQVNPLKSIVYGFKVIGITLSIISFVFGNWMFPILVFIIPYLLMYSSFKFEKKKEIDLLTSKFLELYKLEYKSE